MPEDIISSRIFWKRFLRDKFFCVRLWNPRVPKLVERGRNLRRNERKRRVEQPTLRSRGTPKILGVIQNAIRFRRYSERLRFSALFKSPIFSPLTD